MHKGKWFVLNEKVLTSRDLKKDEVLVVDISIDDSNVFLLTKLAAVLIEILSERTLSFNSVLEHISSNIKLDSLVELLDFLILNSIVFETKPGYEYSPRELLNFSDIGVYEIVNIQKHIREICKDESREFESVLSFTDSE